MKKMEANKQGAEQVRLANNKWRQKENEDLHLFFEESQSPPCGGLQNEPPYVDKPYRHIYSASDDMMSTDEYFCVFISIT